MHHFTLTSMVAAAMALLLAVMPTAALVIPEFAIEARELPTKAPAKDNGIWTYSVEYDS
ncbi:hypothetical protein DFP72DRAFT_1168696 [Ephemerocybe angulata]|uniref:Uncharacterized protein n=1 Tax=Ephemerocybe angulata TaxID=980116 RepID=A0A8H6I134_9AGAR|nr:hypothetical protein DFP72DRAFT_1168696 [Tulosesus angulatus]